MPKKLEKQIPLFEKDPDVGLTFTDAIFFSEKGDICQLYKKFKPPRGRIFPQLFRKYFLCITSVMLRKTAIENMSWFDERLNFIEDACFFWRLAYKHKLDYCDEPLTKYRVRFDSGTIKDFGCLAEERNLALQTLREEFPEIDEKFSRDIKIYQVKTNAQKAINEWANNQSSKAREILKSTYPKSSLIYVLYLITFLPRSTFNYLYILNHEIKNWVNWYKFG